MKKLFFTLMTAALAVPAMAQINCSTLSAGMNPNINNMSVQFINTSTNLNIPSALEFSYWNFGDGNGSSSQHASHTYTTAGTYQVQLIHQWMDTLDMSTVCSDTVYQNVTVPGNSNPTANKIAGVIHWDSTLGLIQAGFKVWLIEHDAVANTLTAIDSLTTNGSFTAYYEFNNVASGSYRTKAALLGNGTSWSTTFIPTYHQSSLYWSSATVINHTGGTSAGRDIIMQTGAPTTGPGFIGGSITQGANKGTANGIPDVLVMLRDAATNDLVKFTYTDNNGDYSFSDLPIGTYNIYPEKMNYTTTSSATLAITSTMHQITNINFGETADEIKPKVTSVKNIAASSFFNIYPNPTEGVINISWKGNANGEAVISILDISGRTVVS